MSRYKFCKDHDNQTHIFKAGWVVDIADSDAASLVASGTVVKVADDTPLKKGNLEDYDNCRPLDMAVIQARKAKTPPKEVEEAQ